MALASALPPQPSVLELEQEEQSPLPSAGPTVLKALGGWEGISRGVRRAATLSSF